MRCAGVVAGCVGFALLLSGCDPARDFRYTREGIGTDLYWDGLPTATQLQDIYLANICAQALSPTARSVDTVSCDGWSLGSRDWGLLVQAGMNDIDLRCDAYLSWLHDRRSSREPFLKELAVLGGAAAGILRATEVGATPIALTAIAFGLAADTFTNVDLRLLNGVDYTTVQSVVRGNRTQFRLNNLNLVIDNRPAAIYVLRNYLSICVPASIEMSINNTINVYHRGGPAALQELQIGLRNPVATSATSASVRGTPVVIRTDRPPPDAPPLPAIMAGAIGPVETAISVTSGMALQRSLCVADSGEFDSATRAELRNFKAASLYPSDGSVTDRLTVDSDLRNLRAAQKKFPSCRAAGFLSGFEVGLFSRFGTTKMRDDLKRALIAANLPVPASFSASPAQPMDDTARQVISSLGTKYGLTGQSVIDRPFYEKMLNSLVR